MEVKNSYLMLIGIALWASACGNGNFQAGTAAQHQKSAATVSSSASSSDQLGATPEATSESPAASEQPTAAPPSVLPAPTLPEEDEDLSEETVAETPVVISGAYLGCTARSRPQDAMTTFTCKMPMPEIRKELAAQKEWMIESSGLMIPVGTPSFSDEAGQSVAIFSLPQASMQILMGEIFKESSQLELIKPVQSAMPTFVGEPEVEAKVGNLIQNGSFEFPNIVSNGGTFQKFEAADSVPGWVKGRSLAIELQGDVHGWKAFEGRQWVELDATGSSSIEQRVATEPGKNYLLTFNFAARPDTAAEENILKVRAADRYQVFKKTSVDKAKPNWQLYSLKFTAKDSVTLIQFADGGAGNNVGTFLDDVALELEKE